MEEVHDIVIVGGGICGLATALAFHRKGVSSLVLEKSESLRASGAAVGVHANGWRALDQLKVGEQLRDNAILLAEMRNVHLRNNQSSVMSYRNEIRCLQRKDLIETLADNLPTESICFGCHVVGVTLDPITSFPIVSTSDGNAIKAKVLIGCDGSNSVVAQFLGLEAPKHFPMRATRGFTSYPNGHNFGDQFLQLYGENIVFGRIPVDAKLVYFFTGRFHLPEEPDINHDPYLIKDFTLKTVQGLPEEIIDTVMQCDIDSLSLTHVYFRLPWHLISASFQRGTVAVAGDAMHVMGPFIGQGGSAGLEDAVVLARCLAPVLKSGTNDCAPVKPIEQALRKYVKERRLRILRLSAQSYLVGSLITASSWFKKLACIALLFILFRGNSLSHTDFDVGPL